MKDQNSFPKKNQNCILVQNLRHELCVRYAVKVSVLTLKCRHLFYFQQVVVAFYFGAGSKYIPF
ncbi:hypothetical protein SLEP1_g52095 [Rubroshorea leprosula]|uniref:Uncharacterized protein n=1 Tax=Rubroshorea leprosula TaxID=152421 RepID=A0AAV5M576_9ROSI|nr:hypothetical protein SLEP1_g52095 [Rubroshorea leprosula]